MNAKALAAKLNGRQYREEITSAEENEAKKNGLVVVFGASDDLMEFRGSISDEIGAYEGTKAYLSKDGLLVNDCENDDCPHFKKLKKTATTITAIWDKKGYSWQYETVIPHATFEVLEDDDKYCRGIVFKLEDV